MPTQFMKLGYEDRVIREDGFYNILLNGEQVGFNLDLRVNYYRGLPVSSIQKLELYIDGEKIPEYLMQFVIHEKTFLMDQLPELYSEFWGIKTPAHLRVFNNGLLPGQHDVKVRLEFKSPYMEFAPGVHGMIDGSEEKSMIIGEGREL